MSPSTRTRTFRRTIRSGRGFTLVEVMIASGILFVCLFAILGLLANILRNARFLQRASMNDAGTAAAYFSSLTNLHEPGTRTYAFSDMGDFSDRYRDLKIDVSSEPFDTNGLWFVEYIVTRKSTGQIESSLSTLEFDLAATKKNMKPGQ
jgi:hypothetical protein